MAEAKGRKGYLGGSLKYVAIFLILLIAFIVIAYRRFGGSEGFRRWFANQTINEIEKQVLKDKLYNVSEDEIKKAFKEVKDANSDGKTDQTKLYQVLKRYQQQFKDRKPSADDVNEFLQQLHSTIIPEQE